MDAWLDIVAIGFWERQRSAFFNVSLCHLNADSYRDLDPDQIFRQNKTEKKSQLKYASEVYCRASLILAISFQHDRWYGSGM